MSNDERYQQARQRARALRYFYQNLIAFLAVNVALFIFNAVVGGGWWFYWVTLFWGIGLVSHGFSLFGRGFFSQDWEDRKVRELMEQEKRKNNDG